MRYAAIGLLMLLNASVASAQSRTGIFGGYSFASPDFHASNVTTGDRLSGWVAGVDVVTGPHFGAIARVDGDYGNVFRQGVVTNPLGVPFRPSVHTFTAGPRLAVLSHPRVAVFLDGLFGVAYVGADIRTVDAHVGQTSAGFVGGGGGGFEVALQRTLDVAFDIQYRRTNLFDEKLDLVQMGVALVVRPWRR